MFVFIFLIFTLATNGDLSLLSSLIERIHNERKIHTVYTIGHPSESALRNLDFPKVILTSNEGNANDRIEYEKNVLLLVVAMADRDYLIQGALENLMEPIIRRRFVIIQADDLSELERYFSWFWTKNFPRIFGITSNETYAYLPFADCTTQKVSSSGPIPDALRDLNGYAVRTSVGHHIPTVFRYKDKNGNSKIGGSVAQIFFGFLQKHNATYVDVKRNHHEIFSHEMDMSMDLHTSWNNSLTCYPARFLRYGMVVPYNGYISPNEYFTRPYQTSIWIVLILTVCYITFMQVICDYFINRRLRVWQICSQIFCVSIGFPTERRIIGAYRLYILTYVFFFILYSLYVSLLTSFLTVFIKSWQFNTFEDIIDNDLQILVDRRPRAYIVENIALPPGFQSQLIEVSTDLATNWFGNSSVGYISTDERAEFLLSQQTYLKQPLFRVFDEVLTYVYMAFVLQKHSPFYDTCNRYVMEILQSGLMTKWVSDSFYQGREGGILKMLHDEDQPLQPLTLRHFTFPRNLYVLGLALSLAVFIGEVAFNGNNLGYILDRIVM